MQLQWFIAVVLLVTASTIGAETGPNEGVDDTDQGVESSQYIKVINVASDDALNIRATPDGDASVLAKMPPNAKALKLDERGNWLRVVYRGKVGWVHSHYTAASKAPEFGDANLNGLACSGSEPHWMLTTKGSRLTYGMYDESRDYWIDTEINPAVNQRDLWYATAYSSPADGKAPKHLKLIIQSDNQCSDDMSDLSYKYSVFLVNDADNLLVGCCN